MQMPLINMQIPQIAKFAFNKHLRNLHYFNTQML